MYRTKFRDEGRTNRFITGNSNGSLWQRRKKENATVLIFLEGEEGIEEGEGIVESNLDLWWKPKLQ